MEHAAAWEIRESFKWERHWSRVETQSPPPTHTHNPLPPSPAHLQTSSDRPGLIINLCESDVVDVMEIIHFLQLKSKSSISPSLLPVLERRPADISESKKKCVAVCVCVCGPLGPGCDSDAWISPSSQQPLGRQLDGQRLYLHGVLTPLGKAWRSLHAQLIRSRHSQTFISQNQNNRCRTLSRITPGWERGWGGSTLSLTKEVVYALICLIRALVLFKSEKNQTVHVLHAVLHFLLLFVFSGMKDGN